MRTRWSITALRGWGKSARAVPTTLVKEQLSLNRNIFLTRKMVHLSRVIDAPFDRLLPERAKP